jgi:signal transduction histidine kinase
MYRKVVIGALTAMVLMFSTTAFAQDTPAAAQAMLAKAVAAVKADKAKALDMFNKGEGGFLQGDLYPFCFNAGNGVIVAEGNPTARRLLGTDVRALTDPTGNVYGQKLYAAAQKPEGQITSVSYEFQKTGGNNTVPVPKESFVTRVDDLGCGVGYYRY